MVQLQKRGWGHSTAERAVEVARKAVVKQLVLFHHDPTHDYKTVKKTERQAQSLLPAAAAAYEEMKIELLKI